jgi:hypothetical protein
MTKLTEAQREACDQLRIRLLQLAPDISPSGAHLAAEAVYALIQAMIGQPAGRAELSKP